VGHKEFVGVRSGTKEKSNEINQGDAATVKSIGFERLSGKY